MAGCRNGSLDFVRQWPARSSQHHCVKGTHAYDTLRGVMQTVVFVFISIDKAN